MPCYKLLLQMAQNCVIAAIMAIDASEQHNASLYHGRPNALLPDDTAEPEGVAAISSSTGHRVDVQALLPTRRPAQHLGFASGPFDLKNQLKKTEGHG